MAYIEKSLVQTKQKQLALLNKKYGISARFSGSNSSTLTLTITSGKIEFFESMFRKYSSSTHHARFDRLDSLRDMQKQGYMQVNHYYLDNNFEGIALEYLQAAYAIMQDGHWDESDIQTDYFSCSWYNRIAVGHWNKPYELEYTLDNHKVLSSNYSD